MERLPFPMRVPLQSPIRNLRISKHETHILDAIDLAENIANKIRKTFTKIVFPRNLVPELKQYSLESIILTEILDTLEKHKCNSWRVWLTANRDFTLGTFIELCPNGVINRVTLHEDGTDSIFRIDSDEL